jgi:hypothetical protein
MLAGSTWSQALASGSTGTPAMWTTQSIPAMAATRDGNVEQVNRDGFLALPGRRQRRDVGQAHQAVAVAQALADGRTDAAGRAEEQDAVVFQAKAAQHSSVSPALRSREARASG